MDSVLVVEGDPTVLFDQLCDFQVYGVTVNEVFHDVAGDLRGFLLRVDCEGDVPDGALGSPQHLGNSETVVVAHHELVGDDFDCFLGGLVVGDDYDVEVP